MIIWVIVIRNAREVQMASTGHRLTTSVEIVGVVTKVSTIAVHIASPAIENMT